LHCRFVEEFGDRSPPLQCCPLRSSAIPKFMTIDTEGLALWMVTDSDMARELFGVEDKASLFRFGALDANADRIWGHFFATDSREFRPTAGPDWIFANMVETDGESVRVLFKRRDDPGRLRRHKPPRPKPEPYVTHAAEADPLIYGDRNIVAGDPGKQDIIYLTDDSGSHLRYTQAQRRKETKTNVFRDERNVLRARTVVLDEHDQPVVAGCTTVKDLEEWLGRFSSKTTDEGFFAEYLTAKNRVDFYLQRVYEQRIYRRLRWYAFVNRARSEGQLVRRFRRLFGGPNEVAISWGDWSRA
jgi:hypothetical protein